MVDVRSFDHPDRRLASTVSGEEAPPTPIGRSWKCRQRSRPSDQGLPVENGADDDVAVARDRWWLGVLQREVVEERLVHFADGAAGSAAPRAGVAQLAERQPSKLNARSCRVREGYRAHRTRRWSSFPLLP